LEIIGDSLIICFGSWSIFVFINLIVYKGLLLVEPSPVILWGELITAGIIVGIGIERLVDDMRRRKR